MMDLTRRSMVAGLGALIGGGKTVAAEVGKAVMAAGAGVGAVPTLADAMSGGERPPTAGLTSVGSGANTLNKIMRTLCRKRRQHQLTLFNFGFRPDIAGLRSVPMHTKMRMQEQADAEEGHELLAIGRALGMSDKELGDYWATSNALEDEEGRGLLAKVAEKFI